MSRVAPEWVLDATGTRLVVLGADGFIGSAVARIALGAGATVVAACVGEPWRLRDLAEDRLERVPAGRWWDARAQDPIARWLAGADALVLLAYVPPSHGADAEAHERRINMAGAEAAARVAADAGARIVFASSADVYGPWHATAVDEQTTPRPRTPYARVKLATERVLSELCGAPGAAVSLRIATTFGPGELGHRAIPRFLRAALQGVSPVIHGAGTDLRDYVHVDDVGAAIVNACILPVPRAPVLNIGSGRGRTTLDLLEDVGRAVDAPLQPRHEASSRDPSRLVLDIQKATAELGLRPSQDFGRLLREEARWLAAWHASEQASPMSRSGRRSRALDMNTE